MEPEFKRYCADYPEGWSLHAALIDKNVGDAAVRACFAFAVEVGDARGAVLAVLLLNLTRTQRLRLSYRAFGS